MIKLKYDNWSKITIDVYERLKTINTEPTTEEETFDANVKLLSILCDCSEDDIINLPLLDFTILMGKTEFLKTMPKYNLQDKYIIGDKMFDVVQSVKKMSTAQFIDFQTLVKNKDENTANILACFIIPHGKKYGEDYDIMEVAEFLKHNLDIARARSILFFFTLQYQALQTATLDYSIRQMRKQMKKEKNEETKKKMGEAIEQAMQVKILLQNGVGFI